MVHMVNISVYMNLVNHYEEEYPLCKYNMVSRYKSHFETRKYDSPIIGMYVGLC